MPEQDLIDVRFIVDGQPLQEYCEPEASDEGTERLRYVEITADALYCQTSVDTNDFHTYRAAYKKDIFHLLGTLTVDHLECMSGNNFKNELTREWEYCPWVIGPLGITERDPIALGLTPMDLRVLGSIRVNVFRAKVTKREVSFHWQGQRPSKLGELPEKVMKGSTLTNNVKYPNGITTEAPKAILHNFDPMNGNAGRRCTFKFMYRSRKTLQNIGCIPRSPSPSPDTNLTLERAEDTIRVEKQRAREANLEILRLREELARSRSGSHQTSILTDSDPFTPTTSLSGSTIRGASARQSPHIKSETTVPRSLESRNTRPQPPLFGVNDYGRISAGPEDQALPGRQNTTRTGRDLSIAEEVDDILRSVENQETGQIKVTPGQNNRKRPAEDDDDEIVELPPKKPKTFEIVGLTDD